MADPEDHSVFWWFFHKIGIVHTTHENAENIICWYSQYEILDDNGDFVEIDKMSDVEVLEFNREVLRRKLKATTALTHSADSQWAGRVRVCRYGTDSMRDRECVG